MNRRIVANSSMAQRLALRSGSFSRIYACQPSPAHSSAGGTCDINPYPPGAGCSRRTFRGLDGVLLKRAKSAAHRAASRLATAHVGIRTLPQASWGLLALTVPSLPGRGFAELGGNPIFVTGFWAWFIAQFLKIFTKRYKKGIWDLKAFLDSGGMPSSHSSLCMGVTTSIAMLYGLGSSLFAVSLCFSLIVMYDAAGVRRHAGHQAEVLNVVVQEIMSGHAVSQRQLKEVLGHTPLQVVCGATLGLLVGAFYPQLAGF